MLHYRIKITDYIYNQEEIIMLTTNINSFPEDITIEILSRLPAKFVLRFRCVCKSWLELTKKPSFISKHFQNNSTRTRLFVDASVTSAVVGMGIVTSALYLFHDEKLANLSYEDIKPQIHDKFVGYHDGLFCIMQSSTNRLTIWNPATREFRNLPNYKYCNSSNRLIPPSTFICLESDPINNDFKLLFVHNLWNEKRKRYGKVPNVQVYGFRTNSWREVHGHQLDRYFVLNGGQFGTSTYLKKVCYWLVIADTRDLKVILSFHMDNEVFEEIKIPPHVNYYSSISLYEDSLSIVIPDAEQCFEIWVMNDNKCWAKHLTLGPFFNFRINFGFWKNDAFFLESNSRIYGGCLFLHEHRTKEIKNLQVTDPQFVVIYKESLMTIQ
ncbi:putative F-box protein At3g16210 [Citrus sinensis]|nr:putative F-box protein At3g16210 [Citrus sinensis]